jgi:peptidoglycan/LPS O-acetylase OafA/YrhL
VHKINRSISIQVLRGISVSAVILFHTFPSSFKAGYLGVDLFFIISGFVVAPLINNVIESQSLISELKSFYVKRYWRLIPALTFTLIATLIIGIVFSGVGYLQNLFYSSLSTQLLFANYFAYKVTGDYFRPNPNPLIHTWSLSVEEQIYLLLPLILILLIKVAGNSFKIQYFYLIFGVISFVLFLSGWPKGSVFGFYSFHTRFFEFSIGALLQFYIMKNSSQHRINRTYHFLPLVVLIILLLFGPDNFVYVVALITLFFNYTFFNLDKILPNSIIKPLVNLGDKSYSLYLVHMPVIWLINQISDFSNYSYLKQTIFKIVGLVVIYITGNLLYIFVENRYRYENYRVKSKKKAFVKVQASLLIMTLVGITAGSNSYFLTNTVLQRPPTEMDPGGKGECNVMISELGCRYINSASDKRYLLIGDSTAGMMSKTIKKIMMDKGSLDIFLKTGCQFIYLELIIDNGFKQDNECQKYIEKISSKIKSNNYDGIIVSYISIVDKSALKNDDYNLAWQYKYSSLKILQNKCNCKVVNLGPTPIFPTDIDFFSPGRRLMEGNENASTQVKITNMNQIPFKENTFWTKNLFRDKNIVVINLIDEFCNLDECIRWSNGWLFADYIHLSSLGSKKIESTLRTGIDDAKI